MQHLDDATLVREIIAGEINHFAEVVRRYDDAVRSIVTRRLRDSDAVEELVQQTFYLAFRRLDQLQEPQRLRAWLVRIARNCVAEHHRRLARHEHETELSRVESVAQDRSAEWIWGEVDRLPPAQREVLLLRYRAELTYAEIAEQLGVPIPTVRGRIHEARRELRQRLLP